MPHCKTQLEDQVRVFLVVEVTGSRREVMVAVEHLKDAVLGCATIMDDLWPPRRPNKPAVTVHDYCINQEHVS